MSTLVPAIQSKLNPNTTRIFNAKKVAHFIHTHQTQYPGNWQEYEVTEMSDCLANALNQAARDDETASARIVMLYCR
jgi:hypothetical protein